MHRFINLVLLIAGLTLNGCGTSSQTEFPHALRGPDGEVILFDDVRAILNDASLDAEAKRAALRELGLEDERLIDALLDA